MPSFAEKFLLEEKLGQGHYAEVFKCRHKTSGTVHAVKIINKGKTTTKQVGEFLGEVAVLKELSHANCLKLDGFYDEGDHVYVVLELIQGGELFQKICKERHFSEKTAAQMSYEILSGLAYLHGKGIIHRDLKPENLLLTSAADDAKIKIVDFGFAEKTTPESKLTKCCGTPLYIAPEVLNAGLFKTGPPYGLEADMWSFGVILYVLLCGYPPFRAKTQADQFKRVVEGKYDFPPHKIWGQISEEAKDLIRKLIVSDPKLRLTAKQAMEHPWLKTQVDQHLDGTVGSLADFCAEKTWRRAIFGVEAVNRIMYLQRCTKMNIKPNSAVERTLTEATDLVKIIDLNNNYVGPRGLLAVLDTVQDNPNITTLIMGNNGANNTVVERLCAVMRGHPSITSVDLDRNPISHLAGRMILHAIQTNYRIQRLSLEGTVLQPAILTRIALQLHRNQNRVIALAAQNPGDPTQEAITKQAKAAQAAFESLKDKLDK